MSYNFLDAYGSVLTADSSIISGSGTTGVQRPIVNIGSIIGNLSVSNAPASVSGVGVFNINGSVSGAVNLAAGANLADILSAGADGSANTFNELVTGSMGYVFNGTDWDRVRGNTTSGMFVNVTGSVATVGSPASVSGVGLFNVNHTGNGSIITTQTTSNNTSVIARLTNSSVATLQGTNPWIIAFPTASIAGTYAEDSAHTAGERGLFTLGVRNDAVSSFTSANLDYNPFGTDSAGRILTKPFAPEESRVYGVASTVNTGPSSLLAASGAGLRNYITDLLVSNTGSVATLVTFRDIDASVIGRTIAPAGGGSNAIALATPMRTHALNSQVEYTAATATSILHITAFGFRAP